MDLSGAILNSAKRIQDRRYLLGSEIRRTGNDVQRSSIVPADGGTPRQLTDGPHNHGGPLSWSPDSDAIVFSANRSSWPRKPSSRTGCEPGLRLPP